MLICLLVCAHGELLRGSSAQIDVTQCAHNLLHSAGKAGRDTEKLPALYVRASVHHGQEFLEYMLSVIYVESKFNRNALSTQAAYGLMQMTAVAVEDAVVHCSLRPVLDMEHLFDSYTNVRYGSCYLRKLLRETEGNWTRALIAYNGGYLQLQKYDKGQPIVNETANYVLQVERALGICRSTSVDKGDSK